MERPPAPYARARIVTTIITSTIWFLILYVITSTSGGGRSQHMSALEMANVAAFTYLFIPYFSTHGVLKRLFKNVLKGKIIVPAAAQDAHAGTGTENPSQLGATNVVVFGLVPAAIGYYLAIRTNPETMTRGVFALRYSLAGALLCATVVWMVSGKPFLRTMQKPREQRAFAGTPEQYLWRYFALPHGIVNVVINAVLAFALSPVPFAQAGAIVPARHIVVDTVIALVVLTGLLAPAARSQARQEVLLGIAPPAAASKKSVLTACLTVVFGGLAFAVVVGVVFSLTKVPGLNVFFWAAYRGVVLGVYAGWLTKAVAASAINGAPNAEPAASSPSGAVAQP